MRGAAGGAFDVASSQGDAVVHLSTQYLYDRTDLSVSCISGALSQSGRPFTHGFELYFERATLAFEFANLAGEGHLAMPLSRDLARRDRRAPEPR